MSDVASQPELVIEAERPSKEYFRDLFCHREIFYFLAWRDILVRYKQAALGIGWAIIRPILNMVVFTLVFGRIAHLPSMDIPYPLFVFSGLLPWQFVSGAISDTGNSLINNVNLITKIYFPRMILSTAVILVHMVDFGINLALMFALMLMMQCGNLLTLLALPLFIVLSLVLCVGLSLWLSALTAKYRDFRFIVAFVVQFGLFASPVGYASFLIPGMWKWIYFLNPMVGIIDGFRWALFGMAQPNLEWSLLFSVVISSLILVSGIHYFRKMERTFADRI